MKIFHILLIIVAMPFLSCNVTGSSTTNQAKDSVGQSDSEAVANAFNQDTAYNFIKTQTDFGPRVTGTEGNRRCREWIVARLKAYTDTVILQNASLVAFNGDRLAAVNVFAQTNRQAKKRILLLAHYDTRPWADEDPNPSNRKTPILGANDGGSGVAVLLEIARQLKTRDASVGVDFLFVDAEDYGDSSGNDTKEESWALGTQYWTKNMPYTDANRPEYAILLDIVGGIDAKFYREYFSEQYASAINTKVWTAARAAGNGARFVNSRAGAVTDDHIHINRAGIPCVDIIECNHPMTGSFPPTWHTLADDINSIDRSSLYAVGSTVLQLILSEK